MTGWIRPDWPAPGRVRALVTTRQAPDDMAAGDIVPVAAGASRGPYAHFNLGTHVGDDADAVSANRAYLRGLLPAEPRWLEQVHGIRVADADADAGDAEAMALGGPPAKAGRLLPQADAAVARRLGIVLAILTADCLPVLLSDRAGSVVAVAHAGWRGLAAGVIENAVRAMAVPAASVMAWLGPAIGPTAYEVGEEVVATFTRADPAAAAAFVAQAPGKFLADLYALARQRLAAAGVTAVFGGGDCTYSDAGRYFSYRRDGRTGRMASLVWMEES